jgi:hypothetical protein
MTPDNITFLGGASLEPGKVANTQNLRSGNPNDIGVARFALALDGQGHYLQRVAFNYSYLVGYSPAPGVVEVGSSLQLVLVNPAGEDVKVLYQSANLTDYPWDHYTSYSPPVVVDADNLKVPNDQLLLLELRVQNHDRNLNLQLPIAITVEWSSELVPNPQPSPPLVIPATNALAVTYGTLRFALPLTELRTVTHVWQPFNNTDIDMTTNSTWNYAIVRNQSAVVHASGSMPRLPFDLSDHAYVVTVTAVQLHGWTVDALAASEPPPSPVDCEHWQCGDTVQLVLVPYGQTDLRITAFPWL